MLQYLHGYEIIKIIYIVGLRLDVFGSHGVCRRYRLLASPLVQVRRRQQCSFKKHVTLTFHLYTIVIHVLYIHKNEWGKKTAEG